MTSAQYWRSTDDRPGMWRGWGRWVSYPGPRNVWRAPPSARNLKRTPECTILKRKIQKFSLQRSHVKIFEGPSRMFSGPRCGSRRACDRPPFMEKPSWKNFKWPYHHNGTRETHGHYGPPIGSRSPGVEWSRDRWRHVTPKGQSRDPIILKLGNILRTSGRQFPITTSTPVTISARNLS